MKLLILAITLLTSAGSTLGDGEAGCTFTPRKPQLMLAAVNRLADICLEHSGYVSPFVPAANPGDRETRLKTLCDKRGPIRECLRSVDPTSEACLDRTHHQTYQITRELMDTVLDAGCTQDGAVIASMVSAYFAPPLEINPFRECISAERRFRLSFTAMSSWSYLTYREAINIQECFQDITDGDHRTLTINVTAILKEITDRVKCEDPRDGSRVLCKTVSRSCPVGSTDERNEEIDNILWRCVEKNVFEDARGVTEWSMERVQVFMAQRCARGPKIDRCWAHALSLSSACLDDTQHAAVARLGKMLRGALRYGCDVHGRPHDNLLLRMTNYMRSTFDGSRNLFLECIVIANEHVDTTVIRLDILKGCLLRKLRGHNEAVFYVNTLLTMLQYDMTCLDQVGTVNTTSLTGPKECLFVGEEMSNPKMFFELGLRCIRLHGVQFSHIVMQESYDTLRTLFQSACQRRADIVYCMDDLTALSESCLNRTDHQLLQIQVDLLRDAGRIGCKRDGQVFAFLFSTVFNDMRHLGPNSRLQTCLSAVEILLLEAGSSSDSPQVKSILPYRALERFKKCFNASDYYRRNLVFTSSLNQVARSVKCIHPDDGTLVACETFVNN